MKSLGILSLAVGAGLVAALFALVSGDGVWSALYNYLVVGTFVTLGLAAHLVLRAWLAERRLVLRSVLHSAASQGSK